MDADAGASGEPTEPMGVAGIDAGTTIGHRSAAGAGEEAVLDRGILEWLREEELRSPEHRAVDILTLFVHATRLELRELRSALAADDAATVARYAHSIKGTCANFGAARVAARCADLEQTMSLPEADAASRPAHLAAIEAEFEQVIGSLQREFPDFSP